MPVPNTLSDISTVAATNSPQGTESAKGTIDDYLRTAFAFIAQLVNLAGGPTTTLASSASVAIGFANTANIGISGNATITGFDVTTEGALRHVVFSGAATLTHNAASLILPGAANIVTASGDAALFKSLGGGNWKCMHYQRAAVGAGAASSSSAGYLTAADWLVFNGKQAALGYTPYDSANPSNFITASAAVATFFPQGGGNLSGSTILDNGVGLYGREAGANRSGTPRALISMASDNNVYMFNGAGGYFFWFNTAGANIASLSSAGNFSALTFSATSDERKKKHWQRLPADFLDRLADIRKSGLFSWRKGGLPGVGVGAQSLEAILPVAVETDAKGHKSVNYGAAALVSAVELAREVVKLRARLDALEAK